MATKKSNPFDDISAKNEIPLAENYKNARSESEAFKLAKLESDAEINGQNLGVMGRFFGSKVNAQNNISGLIVIITSLIVIGSAVVGLWIGDINQTARENAMRFGILALGYLFGKVSK